MSDSPRTGTRWRFGAAVFDDASHELKVGGQPVELAPKPLEVLALLLRHAGEVVTKEELLDGVWGDRVVGDTVIARAVSLLRNALHDVDGSIVRTVHRYGYRLAIPVQKEGARVEAGPARALPPLLTLRLSYDGSQVNSRRFPREHEREILAEHGARIRVFELQGHLNFDATDAIARTVLEALPGTQFVILDLHRVTDVDPASTRRLADLARDLAQAGTALHFAGAEVGSAFRRNLARAAPDLDIDVLMRFPDADYALEWCEDRLIAEHARSADTDAEIPLEQQSLFEELSAAEIEQIRVASRPRDFAAGEALFQRGDPAQSIFLIAKGRIDILLSGEDGRERRIIGYSDGMPLGEVAVLSGGRRSFTARAVTPSRCYEMNFPDLDPVLRAKLLTRLSGMVALRLAKYASNERILGGG